MCRRMAGWPIKKVLATPAVASLKSSKSRISKLCGDNCQSQSKAMYFDSLPIQYCFVEYQRWHVDTRQLGLG